MKILGTFRCENEMDNEYDVSNILPVLLIVSFHSTLEAIITFSTCNNMEEEDPGNITRLKSQSYAFFILCLYFNSKVPIL